MARSAAILFALTALTVAACAVVEQPPVPRASAALMVPIDDLVACYHEAVEAHRTVCPRCEVPRLDTFSDSSVAQVHFPARGGRATVRYDADRMRAIKDQHGRDAIVGIFAHELGHVYTEHSGTAVRCPWFASDKLAAKCQREELSADAYAGCLLVALRRNMAPFQAWLATTNKGRVHPAGDERAEAVRIGAERCVGLW
jgi:hypothetical protein